TKKISQSIYILTRFVYKIKLQTQKNFVVVHNKLLTAVYVHKQISTIFNKAQKNSSQIMSGTQDIMHNIDENYEVTFHMIHIKEDIFAFSI
ncbi:hypothetical protein ACJX0J_033475, partial [Zea mays]